MSIIPNNKIEAKLINTDTIDFSAYWKSIRRHLFSICLLGIFLTTLVALIVWSLPSTYSASATLLIETEQANVLSIEEVYGINANNKEYYQTQYEILRSRKIASKVVEKLDLVNHPLFSPQYIEENKGALKVFVDNIKQSVRDTFTFLPQQKLMPKTPEHLAQYRIDMATKKVIKSVSIVPVKNTQAVKIVAESESPEVAALLANAVGDVYIEHYLEAKLTMTEKATAWLTDRLSGLKDKLSISEKNLTDFYESNQLVDIDGVVGLTSDKIQNLSKQLAQQQAKLKDLSAAYNEINSKGNDIESIILVADVLNHPSIQSLRKEEISAASNVSELGKVYGPKHPRMVSANAELKSLRDSLNQQIKAVSAVINTDYRTTQYKITNLTAELDSTKKEFRLLSKLENTRKALQREVDINQQLYSSFFTRLKETDEIGGFESSNARVLDAARTPSNPSKPKKEIIVIVALILSLGFGMLLAIILDSLNSGIRSHQDVEKNLDVELLGIVPLQKKKKNKPLPITHFFDTTNHVFSEALRSLRTNLLLKNSDTPHKVMLITSSVPKEGKTTVAINLAFAMGTLRKTLLIDTDLRKPTLAKRFGLPTYQPGLSNLLVGTHALAECVVNDKHSGIDIISAGTVVENPQELLASDKFSALIEQLKSNYEQILCDSAPVQAVSDPVVVSKVCDYVVYVVKADDTSEKVIQRGIHRFWHVGKRVEGVVLSQINLKKAKRFGDYAGLYDEYGYHQTTEAIS